eukprot:jgi/Bigna1/145343/aug1.98_g20051
MLVKDLKAALLARGINPIRGKRRRKDPTAAQELKEKKETNKKKKKKKGEGKKASKKSTKKKKMKAGEDMYCQPHLPIKGPASTREKEEEEEEEEEEKGKNGGGKESTTTLRKSGHSLKRLAEALSPPEPSSAILSKDEYAPSGSIYVAGDGVTVYNATLTQVDLRANHNRSYKMHVIKQSKSRYYLFRRWGRTGAKDETYKAFSHAQKEIEVGWRLGWGGEG